ncbi:hypothetical protein [Pengzhenrongella phosphoraccumulans]|jgi:hypothetical protein|uniref:hypothetical protein n=1 Tax=Pengzhenrongella phosphoraccumulans TaxID=3114394 RepID=UPI003890D52F
MDPTRAAKAAPRAVPTIERPEVHNAAVDAVRRRQGACAQVHLPTGRICVLRHGHGASCEFVPAGEADASLARHRLAGAW